MTHRKDAGALEQATAWTRDERNAAASSRAARDEAHKAYDRAYAASARGSLDVWRPPPRRSMA